jgi:aspartyl-tRNA(Asn)/glutamyl-tRNA(Gln) amidotransferase subunit B
MTNSKYTPVIGLEVHAELKTNSKMFCGCKNDPFGAEKPNIHTCPVCLGMPGALPVANKRAIDWTVKLGLALGCQINKFSKFDRKHYFYPDLAKSYQISQFDLPFCFKGTISTQEGEIGITRIHLEEDTGKLLHKVVDGKKVSLIDFNRSSVPLAEIVSEPDIKSGSQAKEYGKKLRQIMRYLDIANCDMEQGGMRLEANISLKPADSPEGFLPDYKVEVKNINSFRFLEQAIDFEIKRQAVILDSGRVPTQETRGWDSVKNETFSQRSKEDAEDYRYFPDPDLAPIRFSEAQIKEIRQSLPELPEEKVARWQKDYGLTAEITKSLTETAETAEWMEKVFAFAKTQKIDLKKLSHSMINKKFHVKSGERAEAVIEKFNQLHDTEEISVDEIGGVIATVFTGNQDAVEKYRAGQKQVIGFLIGQVMQKIGKKIDPKIVREEIEKKLN